MASDQIVITDWTQPSRAPELYIIHAWTWCVDNKTENLAFTWLIFQTCLNHLAIENPTGPHCVLFDPGNPGENKTLQQS